jgi:hypothetical protein
MVYVKVVKKKREWVILARRKAWKMGKCVLAVSEISSFVVLWVKKEGQKQGVWFGF